MCNPVKILYVFMRSFDKIGNVMLSKTGKIMYYLNY